MLEGSVRRAGDRVRIAGQLIEAATGAHLWADRFDGTLEDVFDPTGAGDTFGAAYVTFWLRGLPPREALTLASAAGALAVGKKGPMEGTSTQADFDAFLNTHATKVLP